MEQKVTGMEWNRDRTSASIGAGACSVGRGDASDENREQGENAGNVRKVQEWLVEQIDWESDE